MIKLPSYDPKEIPHVIHQTWADKDVPYDLFGDYPTTWIDNHPSWNYHLWTDDDVLSLVKSEYQWFLPTFIAYPLPIQRADAARYTSYHLSYWLYCVAPPLTLIGMGHINLTGI